MKSPDLIKRSTAGSTGVLCVMVLLFSLGVVLLGINLYGLTQSVRMPGLGMENLEDLRFTPREVWSYERSMKEIAGLAQIDQLDEAATQAVTVVNRSLIHPDWFRVDPVEYRQLIPVWENYILHLVGRFSGLPQFERYHFADYRRSIRRGIGMCGDASTVLSSVLDDMGVENRIISFRGHVIVEFLKANGQWQLADPDFGVLLSVGLPELLSDAGRISNDYLNAGYSQREVNSLQRIYRTPYAIFEDVYHFMTLRFVFEYVSYILKWLLPAFLITSGLWCFRGRRRQGMEHGKVSN